jgi:hypothetical protein
VSTERKSEIFFITGLDTTGKSVPPHDVGRARCGHRERSEAIQMSTVNVHPSWWARRTCAFPPYGCLTRASIFLRRAGDAIDPERATILACQLTQLSVFLADRQP